ncbi:39S ribosomal protein L53/MRP-L53 [Microdochium nivale]|nr:39S ribosomal protein L53/MRP-L53 [Microdochium nivale]
MPTSDCHTTSTNYPQVSSAKVHGSKPPQSPLSLPAENMITRFITEVNTKFSPFSATSRATRLFLAALPPNARSAGMVINTTLLPRGDPQPAALSVKFKDGKELKLDSEKLGIKDIMEEVERHSRALQKQASLNE